MTVGDPVTKPRGYPFPGRIVSVFNKHGEIRYVVASALSPGLLHIFSESQLTPATESEIDVVPVRKADLVEAIESALDHEGDSAIHRLADKYCPDVRQAIYDKYAAIAKGGEPGEGSDDKA